MKKINRIKGIIITIVGLSIIRMLLGYAAQLPAGEYIQIGLRAAAGLTSVAITLIVLAGLWIFAGSFLVKLWNELFVETGDAPAEQSLVEGAEAAAGTVHDLAIALERAEQDSTQARVFLADAQQYAEHLVRIVQSIALKAEDMAREITALQVALDAIETTNPVEIAKAAGAVPDDHIRNLMLTEVRDAEYWTGVAKVIGTQFGVLVQWSASYRNFSSRLLTDIAQAKAKLAQAQAVLELAEASRPLAQIDHSLRLASNCLQFKQKPELAPLVRVLPASITAGLTIR